MTKIQHIIFSIAVLAITVIPVISLAQAPDPGVGHGVLGNCTLTAHPKVANLLNFVTCNIISSIIPLVMSLAVASFVWGVLKYLMNSDEEKKREEGRQFMMWGLIALTVMVSIWGIVSIFANTFGIEYVIPQVKGT
ncbi:MAG: hypothetical protein NTZ44_01715 [Candidatus Nomurabacteria bacterium]|nr:hypothetical protein [Candidatus Nomurabacteria bacterium]